MTTESGRAARVRASLALLGSRTFGIYWLASLLSNIGYWANEVAQPWLLLSLGASPFLVGLVVAALCFLCSPLLTFCPVLVRDAFGGSGAAFSIAVSAFGVGGLLGGLVLLGVDTGRDQRRLTVALAVACGAAVIGSGLAPRFWLLPLVLVVAGATLSMTTTLINTLLQVTTSPHRRGQTISLVMFAMRGGMALGSLATGVMVGIVGVRTALVVNGALAVAAQLAIGAVWLRSRLPLSP